MLVYDIGLAASFRSLSEWLQEVERYAGNSVHRILIGNKSDRTDREITYEHGKQFSQENGMPFLETSAKSSNNIDELFLQLAKTLRDLHVDKKLKSPNAGGSAAASKKVETVSLTQKDHGGSRESGGGCC